MIRGCLIILSLSFCQIMTFGQSFSTLQLDILSASGFQTLWEQRTQEHPLKMDSSGYISEFHLYLSRSCDESCDEICEDYLIHQNDTISLHCDFDQGIKGLQFSPSGSVFISHSSYDGPDYDHFYSQRSEIFLYSLKAVDGVLSVDSLSRWTSEEYSIARAIWMDNKQIVLELYSGHRTIAGVDGAHTYGMLSLED